MCYSVIAANRWTLSRPGWCFCVQTGIRKSYDYQASGAQMQIAETVTFGGSGLDRQAHLRKDPAALATALHDGTVLALWRGKPLVAQDRLVWLKPGHPALAQAESQVFLGEDDGTPRFAADISAWSPEAGAEGVEAGFFDPSVQRHPALGETAGFVELRSIMTHLPAREAELVATAKAVLHWHHSHGFCARCGSRSDMVQGGWMRTCPACAAQHFPRTDPVVIMLVTHGNSVLLGRSPGWPEGMFSLLAGFVEPGETVEAAVRREVFEEAGVLCGPVSYLASQPWPFPASLMIGMRADALGTDLNIDPDEIESARWVTREELVSAFAGQHPEIKPSRPGAIAHFILRNWLADRLD
ncbi:NPY1 NTP pyrophosphohydrolases containing a Zn-finger, probably nucleic-acid-binding [Paracoccaceae bacterium]|jgi:NAD+ diphosphatase